jgi:uncharacterized protein
MIRSISISGHGEVRAVPDLAVVNLGVLSSAATAREALDANTKAMTSLMSVLQTASIDSKDISTSNFSVNPRYDYGQNNGQPPKLAGYDVSNTVAVTVRKIATVGDILDKAVSSGSNQINGVSFSIANPQAALNAARKAAVSDAKAKAELYAGAASFTLGNILSLNEGGGYQPPVLMQAKMMAADAASGAPVPIAQGEQIIGIDVNIVWEIK